MGSPIPGSMAMPDIPEHFLMALSTEDEPVLPTHPRARWWGCWCLDGASCRFVQEERQRYV